MNVSKDENLTHFLVSFHRDRPKGRRGIPCWNLSLVLHQLTKASIEPLKKASWLRVQANAGMRFMLGYIRTSVRLVQGVPLPLTQLSKNQVAKEGPASVAPVEIPALTPTLDKLLKGDRSEECVTTWTGPQTSGRTRSWSLSPSRKASTKISHLSLSPLGSSRL